MVTEKGVRTLVCECDANSDVRDAVLIASSNLPPTVKFGVAKGKIGNHTGIFGIYSTKEHE